MRNSSATSLNSFLKTREIISPENHPSHPTNIYSSRIPRRSSLWYSENLQKNPK
jgi:hypothetical protein